MYYGVCIWRFSKVGKRGAEDAGTFGVCPLVPCEGEHARTHGEGPLRVGWGRKEEETMGEGRGKTRVGSVYAQVEKPSIVASERFSG